MRMNCLRNRIDLLPRTTTVPVPAPWHSHSPPSSLRRRGREEGPRDQRTGVHWKQSWPRRPISNQSLQQMAAVKRRAAAAVAVAATKTVGQWHLPSWSVSMWRSNYWSNIVQIWFPRRNQSMLSHRRKRATARVKWVNNNNYASVLIIHCMQLALQLPHHNNYSWWGIKP